MLTGCKTPGAWIPPPTASHRLRPHARGVPLPRPTHPSGDLPASPTPRPAVGGAPAHCPVLRSKPEAGPQPLPGPYLAATGTSSHFPSCVLTLCLWGKGNPPQHIHHCMLAVTWHCSFGVSRDPVITFQLWETALWNQHAK